MLLCLAHCFVDLQPLVWPNRHLPNLRMQCWILDLPAAVLAEMLHRLLDFAEHIPAPLYLGHCFLDSRPLVWSSHHHLLDLPAVIWTAVRHWIARIVGVKLGGPS